MDEEDNDSIALTADGQLTVVTKHLLNMIVLVVVIIIYM